MPSHESEALEDKQKLQTKTFSELAECLARIPPKITLSIIIITHEYILITIINPQRLFRENEKKKIALLNKPYNYN